MSAVRENEVDDMAGGGERRPPPDYQSATSGQQALHDSDYLAAGPPPADLHDSATLLVRPLPRDSQPGCSSAEGCPPPPSSSHLPPPIQPSQPSPGRSQPPTPPSRGGPDDIMELHNDTDSSPADRQEKQLDGAAPVDQKRGEDDVGLVIDRGDDPSADKGQPGEGEEAAKNVPNTHLLMACLVSLCFNLPLGIVAMYLSLKAVQAFQAGKAKLGQQRSRCSVLVSLLAITVTTVIVSSVVLYMATQGHKRINRQRALSVKTGLNL